MAINKNFGGAVVYPPGTVGDLLDTYKFDSSWTKKGIQLPKKKYDTYKPAKSLDNSIQGPIHLEAIQKMFGIPRKYAIKPKGYLTITNEIEEEAAKKLIKAYKEVYPNGLKYITPVITGGVIALPRKKDESS